PPVPGPPAEVFWPQPTAKSAAPASSISRCLRRPLFTLSESEPRIVGRFSPGVTANFTIPSPLHQDAKQSVPVRRLENKLVIFLEGVYLECGSPAAALLSAPRLRIPHVLATGQKLSKNRSDQSACRKAPVAELPSDFAGQTPCRGRISWSPRARRQMQCPKQPPPP